ERAHARQLDLLLVKRRRREVGVDAGGVVGQRQQRVGMRQAQRVRVQLRIISVAEGFCCLHLQHDRLRRALDRWDRYLVVVAEVPYRLDVRIAHVEVERIRGHRRNALDLDIALGLVPERDQRGRTDGDELYRPADDAVVHYARPGNLDPVHLDVTQSLRLGVV